jgi:hypothetical protein
MKNYTIFTAVLLFVFAIAGIPEKVDAQSRGRGRNRVTKVRVVRHTTAVVRIHPRVVRRAHIRYAQLPRWASVVTILPVGAVIIESRVNPYYFHRGIYYTHRANGYVVVRPAAGIRIRVLPVGYRPVIVGPRHYYYYYGTFYSRVDNNDEYEVVDAPAGAIVDALPDGYEVKTVNDTEYYVIDGVYYAEVDAGNIEGGVGYQVVKM